MAKGKDKGTELQVTFKGMSSNGGKGKAAISLNFKRPDAMPLDALDELLTGAQLDIVAQVMPKSDTPDATGQGALLKPDHVFTATCDCDGFATKRTHLQCGLKFNRSAIDVTALDELSGRDGKLAVVRVGDAKSEKASDPDNE